MKGESASIQTQRAMLEHYCQSQGWEVVAVYTDDGYTGLNMNRPDLTRMLKAIERKQIDVVVTKEAYVKLKLKFSENFYKMIRLSKTDYQITFGQPCFLVQDRSAFSLFYNACLFFSRCQCE